MSTRRHRLSTRQRIYDRLPNRKRYIISTTRSKRTGKIISKEVRLGGYFNSNDFATSNSSYLPGTQKRTPKPGRIKLPRPISSKRPNPIVIAWPEYRLTPGLAQVNNFDISPYSQYVPASKGYLLQSWGNDPAYAYKKANKIALQTNTFLRFEETYKTPSGSVDYFPVGRPDLYHRNSGQLFDQYVAWDEGIGLTRSWDFDGHLLLKNLMTNNLLSKVKDLKVNLAQTFAERQQVYNLVGSTAKTLAAAFTDLRRGNLKDFFKTLGVAQPPIIQGGFKDSRRSVTLRQRPNSSKIDPYTWAANKWAEYRWGWMPLYQDVYNSLELLQTNYKRKRRVTTTKELKNETKSTHLSGLGNAWPLSIRDGFQLNGKGSARFVIAYGEPQLLSSFGISNPALLAWELLPYSFVVDSFLNVGKWISTWDATVGVSLHEGVWSSRQIFYRAIEANGTTSNGPFGTWTYEGYANSLARKKILYRERFSDFPYPVLPTLENPLSLTHCLDGIALLVQAFRR